MEGMEKVYTVEDREAYVNWLASLIGREQKVEAKTTRESTIKHLNLYNLEQDMLHTKREILGMTVSTKGK